MVMFLNGDADPLHLADHFATDILLRVSRRHGEIAFLVPDLSSEVHAFFPGVPHTFVRIDEVIAAVTILVVPCLIEYKKFRLRTPVGNVADPSALEILFRLLCNMAWIAVIVFPRD